ncbi:sulfatase [Solwaraspora sp. WMMD1047]|uniref:sulfatase n=1 Tax=Solwaraspora sp. WMMD1047 TaxID=3016102 RepID=UPI0024170F4F|nr:sulfatase [Solwaraspora sp. WMMD1047]MDG4833552.1 sulfatase [Solwaraspora sp. WMMD1047]
MSLLTHLRRLPTQARRTPPGGAAVAGAAAPDGAAGGDGGAVDAVPGGAGGRPRRRRPVGSTVLDVLAGLLVLLVFVTPNRIDSLTPWAFLRIPVDGLLLVALLLILSARPRRVASAVIGVGLGVLGIVKIVDMGFYTVLDRPFDPVLDWILFGAGAEFLTGSIGRTGTVGVAVAALLLAVAVLVLVTLSVLRLTGLLVRHERTTARTVAVFAVVSVVTAVFGVPVLPEAPVGVLAVDRAYGVYDGLRDRERFAAEVKIDAFRDTPGDELLTALRGKDVIIAFVESYGRDAVSDPEYAPQVGAVLADGDRRLAEAGFTGRSGFLTSPTAGGNSWLAHATLMSGLWINNQQRYDNLVVSDRLTLNSAFRRADWRTVGVMPGITRAWPEGDFYGYHQVYDSRNLGYRGPRFNFSSMPDQYTLAGFRQAEYTGPGKPPLMAEIALLSSHTPWAPLPELIDWADVGDGSAFEGMPETGRSVEEVWSDTAQVRTEYRRAVEYTLRTLISYVETYGDDDLVLVFLGDHQPAPLITGPRASRDVPISIVARDPAVLARTAGWGWQDGLMPGPQAPVWRMDTFRDRFLTTFS